MKKNSDGEAFWAYGGDFGEHVHDAMWNINGLTWPDGSWHPSCFQVKKTLCPIRISIQLRPAGHDCTQHIASISFSNGFDPELMSSLGWKWLLEMDGETSLAGELRAFQDPRATTTTADVELGAILSPHAGGMQNADVERALGMGQGREAVLTVSMTC